MILRFSGPAIQTYANELGVTRPQFLRALAELTGGEWQRQPDRDAYELHLKGHFQFHKDDTEA